MSSTYWIWRDSVLKRSPGSGPGIFWISASFKNATCTSNVRERQEPILV
uniref:Uncharacterized protein n=1 Tax=Anguilla anguilla TaxID=7936 RepID=A0A0E9QP49_ANGAN